jgi:HAMP domain-containing protein
MMRAALRAMLSLIGLAVLAYVWFFVPLGTRTLHQHAMRIASTEPAQELGDEAVEATERLAGHVQEQWEARYVGDAGAAPTLTAE